MHEIDEENYPELVEGSKKTFILKAGAIWCAPCTNSRGPFTELAEELKDKFSLGEMDIDKSPNLGSKLFIRSVPSFFKIKNKEVVDQKIGWTTKEDLKKWILS
jgi:thioredoxin 1